jgi:hypothetical protein
MPTSCGAVADHAAEVAGQNPLAALAVPRGEGEEGRGIVVLFAGRHPPAMSQRLRASSGSN